MNNPPLQLEEFFLTKLQIEWHEPPKEINATFLCSFDYDVAQHKTDPNRQRLTFRLTVDSGSSPFVGYVIGCEIVGFFRFDDAALDAQKKAALLRMNGSNILLGILRGQLASITGSFPQRKFVLPAVNIKDIVETVEAAKRKEREEAREATANRELPKRQKRPIQSVAKRK